MYLYELLNLFPRWPLVFRSFLPSPLVARDVVTPLHLVLLCVTFAVVFFTLSLWTMTDTQKRVVINQNTNGLRFEFLRRLVNSCIASEWFIYGTIVTVVVVGAVLYHYHTINSHEARFETTVEAIQKLEEKMVKEFNVLRGPLIGNVKLKIIAPGVL